VYITQLTSKCLYPSIMSNNTFNYASLLQQRAKQDAHRTAFIYLVDGENQKISITYKELDILACKIAAFLQSKGCRQGDRALLLYPSGIDYIAAFFGCLYVGAIAVPLYPLKNNRRALLRMQTVLHDAEARFILSTEAHLQTFSNRQNILPDETVLIATDKIEDTEISDWNIADCQEIAYLQYTSGSTGSPKGVMVAHHNLLHNSRITQNAWGNNASNTIVSWLPLHHDMGLIAMILQSIYTGAACVFMPPVHFIQKPFRWLKVIHDYQANISGAPNFAYDLCVEKISPDQLIELELGSWQIAYNAAEPVRASTIEKFSRRFAVCGFEKRAFCPYYGMAEITLFTTGSAKHELPQYLSLSTEKLESGFIEETSSIENTRTLVSCGKTLDDQNIKIVNPLTLEESSPNEVGEIWLAGPSKTLGYWNKPDETQQIFHAELASTPGIQYLRSGDLGFLKNGHLYIVSRHKDLIIIRGKNYYPIDIEWSAEQASSQLEPNESAAFSIEVNGIEELVILQTVKRTEMRKVNPSEMVMLIRKAIIEDHDINPYEIVLLVPGQIPKTSSGKIQRRLCRQLYLQKNLKRIPVHDTPND